MGRPWARAADGDGALIAPATCRHVIGAACGAHFSSKEQPQWE